MNYRVISHFKVFAFSSFKEAKLFAEKTNGTIYEWCYGVNY